MAYRENLRDWFGTSAADRLPFSRLFDQHFGTTLDDEDLLLPGAYFRPHSRPRRLHSRQQSGVSEVQVEKERFQVMLDVQQFKPREINVKTLQNFVVVEGKHDEREDEHGFISRQFTRRYALPEDVKPENVECSFSSDGVLLIAAARTPKETEPAERTVYVRQTGLPAMNKKDQEKPAASSSGDVKTETSSGSAATTENTSSSSNGATEGRRIDIQFAA